MKPICIANQHWKRSKFLLEILPLFDDKFVIFSILAVAKFSHFICKLICVVRFLLFFDSRFSLACFWLLFHEVVVLFVVLFFHFLSSFHLIQDFWRLYYADWLLSIGQKLAFSFNFILRPEISYSVEVSVFLSDLFTGKKVICHGLFHCWVTVNYCWDLFLYVVFKRAVLSELFPRRVDLIVVNFLFFLFKVFGQMWIKNLTDGLETVKLVFLWLYAFILFPYWASAHLALLRYCSRRSHWFPIYILF